MKEEHPIRLLCQVLSVSPSGYYDWLERHKEPSARAMQDLQLALVIQEIHLKSRKTYGSPRIQEKLAQSGQCHGRNRIARLMRQKHLCGRQKKRFKVRTTDSDHDQPIAPNRLAEHPAPQKPNEVWVGDITYIRTGEGWLYLAGVMDLYSRKIVGWAMGENIDTELVLAGWNMARGQRRPPAGLIFHSDRGVQYASGAFRQALAQAQAQASMSRRANCYDNAAMESFWSTLKHELVYRCEFSTRAQARLAIFDFIESFYNRQRLHSSLDYLSPIDFENKNN
jgi:putative transposase